MWLEMTRALLLLWILYKGCNRWMCMCCKYNRDSEWRKFLLYIILVIKEDAVWENLEVSCVWSTSYYRVEIVCTYIIYLLRRLSSLSAALPNIDTRDARPSSAATIEETRMVICVRDMRRGGCAYYLSVKLVAFPSLYVLQVSKEESRQLSWVTDAVRGSVRGPAR